MGTTDTTKRSQSQQILAYIRENGSIDALTAARLFGCLACHSRISDIREILRPLGQTIHTRHRSDGGRRWADYTIVTVAKAGDQVEMAL